MGDTRCESRSSDDGRGVSFRCDREVGHTGQHRCDYTDGPPGNKMDETAWWSTSDPYPRPWPAQS
jgi:hypothetical protein